MCWLALLFALAGCTEGGTVQGNLPTGFLGGPDGNVVASLDDGAVATADIDVTSDDITDDVPDVTDDVAEVTPDDADGGAPLPDVPDIEVTPDVPDTLDPIDTLDVEEACTPGEPGCDGCSTDAHCLAQDDGNLCNGRSVCVGGACVVDDSLPNCVEDTGDPCTVPACDPATGACVVRPARDGTACDDGDACTPNDRCEAGVCVNGPRITCDDGNVCTVDTCQEGECDFATDDTLFCDDGNGCTTDDACEAGLCKGNPGDACGCVEDADCAAHGDGDACNGEVTCESGTCTVKLSSLVFCTAPDADSCGREVCDPETGACDFVKHLNGTGCDDGDACTVDDQCAVGNCIGNPLSCDEGVCDDTAECDPGTGICAHTPADDGADCADSQVCSDGGTCQAGECVPGLEACPCVEDEDCEAVDDGDLCTGVLTCVQGRCALDQETVVTCTPDGPCKTSLCDPGTGECVGGALGDGTACNDGDGCTQADNCVGGECLGEALECEGDGPCSLGECHPFSGCVTTFVGGVCDNGDGCTELASCLAGQCFELTTIVCDPSQPCVDVVCDPDVGSCVETVLDGASCSDEDPCTDGDLCVADVCEPGPTVVCDAEDENPCAEGACDPETGLCAYVAVPGDCDDGNPCTTGESCQESACVADANDCACTTDEECDAQLADKCVGTATCGALGCELLPDTAVVCDTSSDTVCAVTACVPETGECLTDYLVEGDPCVQSSACLTNTTCTAEGQCEGEAVECDDGNDCTVDSCDPASGCVFTPVADATPCEDDDLCTDGENCQAGECVQGSGVVCDTSADTLCATTACDDQTGECVTTYIPEGEPCAEDDACLLDAECTADGQCAGEVVDCVDEDPCTIDTCDPAVGCVQTPGEDGIPCESDDVCTVHTCQGGLCIPGFNSCFCFSGDADCEQYNEGGDACTGLYVCEPTTNKCVKSSSVTCPLTGKEPCEVNVCNPSTGACQNTVSPGGTACDDGNPCTVDDQCLIGLSICSGSDMVCDDGDDCTHDTCEDGECVEEVVPNSPFVFCDDDDWCTTPNVCLNGECGIDKCPCDNDAYCASEFDSADLCAPVHICDQDTGRCIIDQSSAVTCYDANPYDCLDYFCEPTTGLCSPVVGPEGTACEDEHGICTINDTCDNSSNCVGTWIFECDDVTPDDCVDYQCVPSTGLCGNVPRTAGDECSDGNACTENDVCVAGACQGTQLTCEDDSSCTEDICSASLGCIYPPLFGDCDDGDPCTEGTYCAEGECKTSGTGITNSCGGCTVDGHCAQFDDGAPCNGAWFCDSGTCKVNPASIPVCVFDAGLGDEACHEVSCNPTSGACETAALPITAGCDDGDPCTVYDRCDSGSCAGVTKDCDDGDPCTSDSCHAESGGCINIALSNGQPCDDGDVCNGVDTCQEGACVADGAGECGACSTDEDCADVTEDLCAGSYVCTSGACVVNRSTIVVCAPDPTGCTINACVPETGQCEVSVVPDGTICNDGDLCTADDRCTGGVCGGAAVDCTDDDDCTLDHCDADFGCVHDIFAGDCDDGDPCTKNDVCVQGSCLGVIDNCDDSNQCTNDFCLPGAGCRNSNQVNGFVCADDDVCTITACNDGECVPTSTNAFCFCPNGEDDCTGLYDVCDGTYTCNSDVGKCELIPGTKVTCPEDGECFDYTCQQSGDNAGECVFNDHDGDSCDDGTECTTDDTCVADECIGTDVPKPDLNTCQDAVCVPGEGWLFQHGTGVCELGTCTNDEHCVEGQCAGVPVPHPSTNFDDGVLSSWTVTTSSEQATWQLTGAASTSAPFALHAVNQTTGTTADPGGNWLASATWTPQLVPYNAKNINIRFRVWADFEVDDCDHQKFRVTVDGEPVGYLVRIEGALFGDATGCESTGGDFLEGKVSLDETTWGELVEVGFEFETFTTAGTGGAGVIVDDVSFDWNCNN